MCHPNAIGRRQRGVETLFRLGRVATPRIVPCAETEMSLRELRSAVTRNGRVNVMSWYCQKTQVSKHCWRCFQSAWKKTLRLSCVFLFHNKPPVSSCTPSLELTTFFQEPFSSRSTSLCAVKQFWKTQKFNGLKNFPRKAWHFINK